MNVLVVCLGNICRSPIGEGVLKAKFDFHKIEGNVDSAGVISYHEGDPPDSRAVEVSMQNGIDISQQIARQFRSSDFDDFDLILTMDSSVHNEILSLAKSAQHSEKVKLFLELAGYHSNVNVPDPFYGCTAGFEKVFKMINKGGDAIVQSIIEIQSQK